MYRNIVQWREIRRKILEQGVSQREMCRRTGMSQDTISKIVKNEVPPERAKRVFPCFKNEAFSKEIIETIKQLVKENNGCKITVRSVFEYLKSKIDYPYSYSGLREYIRKNSFSLGSGTVVNNRKRVIPPADRAGPANLDSALSGFSA